MRKVKKYSLFLLWSFLFLTHTFILLARLACVSKMFKFRSKSTAKLLSKKVNNSKFFSKESDKTLDDLITKLKNSKFFGKKITEKLKGIKAEYIKLLAISFVCGSIFTLVGYPILVIIFTKIIRLVIKCF